MTEEELTINRLKAKIEIQVSSFFDFFFSYHEATVLMRCCVFVKLHFIIIIISSCTPGGISWYYIYQDCNSITVIKADAIICL